MQTTLERIQEKLLEPQRLRARQRQRWQVQGRYGEILVRNKLLQSGTLEVIPVPQEQGTKLEWTIDSGKRPDFVVSIIGEDGNPEPGSTVLLDVKCHKIETSREFSIDNAQIKKYQDTMKYWDCPELIFAVVPANAPDKIFIFDFKRMAQDSSQGDYRYTLDTPGTWILEVDQADHDHAVEQLRIESYDTALAPVYPGPS